MPQIDIKISNLTELRQAFAAAPDMVRGVLNGAISRSALIVQRNARIESPVDTSRLRGSIGIALGPMSATIVPNAKYAVFVHEGTGRFARGGGGRSTPWVYKGSDGNFHWTAGQRPNPFMDRAADRSRSSVQALFDAAVSRIVEAL